MSTSIYIKNKTRKKRSDKNSLNKRRDSFFTRVKVKHNNFYNYPFTKDYKTQGSYIRVECSIHGIFKVRADLHLNGAGCKKCYNENRTKSQEQFEKEARAVHGDRYEYGKYNGHHEEIWIECNIHGWFKKIASKHLRGEGCQKCSKAGYSKIAIKWLDSLDLPIQHAENGGEFRIPKTRYDADGYDESTNTVYEFHGDDWHGNPNKHLPEDKCHPFNKEVTAKELYNKTIERENEIKSLGYNLVVIWESDYNKSKEG